MKTNWNEYNEQTKDNPSSPLLAEALSYTKKEDNALDLGSGGFRDTRALIEAGFKNVDAVDSNEGAMELAKTLLGYGKTFHFFPVAFHEFPFQEKTYDLVNAQNALPFAGKHLAEVLEEIKGSLARWGVFSANFFGFEDGWAQHRHDLAFVSKQMLEEIFPTSDWNIHKLEEEVKMAPLAAGGEKKWHFISLIATKIR